MKKVFALVLVVAMMMGVTAFANAGVVQDQMAPQVVSVRVCDANGNVIAEVENSDLILTDVNARATAADEVVVTRLTDAYEGVMEVVHHSDVECTLHEHDVKVDIDDVLASMNQDLDSHDLVMYELFDIASSDEVAAMLVDGCYLEVTLMLADSQSAPLVALFSADGISWQVIPVMSASGNVFTVHLSEVGTIALLEDGHKIMNIGQPQTTLNVTPSEDGADMSNFTSSVSGKPAPQMSVFTGANGEPCVGQIYNANGEVEMEVPDQNYVVITSVAERYHVADIQTHEHLEWGYDSIVNAADVGDLYTDNEEKTLAGDLDAMLASMGLNLTHDQLVVKDMFEVTAYGDYLHALYDEEHYMEVTFETDLDPSVPLVVIHSMDSVHWHVHPAEEAVVNADGTVTLKMYDMGAVAFLVEKPVDAEMAVQSPD